MENDRLSSVEKNSMRKQNKERDNYKMRQNGQIVGKLVEEKGVEYLFQHYALYQEEFGALGFRRVEVAFPESVQKKGISLFTLLTVVYTPSEGLHEYGCYTEKGIDHPLIQKMLQSNGSHLAPKDGEKWKLFEQLIQQWQVAYTIWQGWRPLSEDRIDAGNGTTSV